VKDYGFSGTSLLLALSCIFVLTMVVPPGLATLVNRARIDRAQRQVAALAAQLGRALERQGADAAIGSADLLGGQGSMPAVPDDSGWATGRVAALDTYVSSTTSADPWGNRYLVNIGVALSPATAEKPSVPGERGSDMLTAMWVLSAGPNGIIETPFNALASSASLGGDDIGARIDDGSVNPPLSPLPRPSLPDWQGRGPTRARSQYAANTRFTNGACRREPDDAGGAGG
jgi:type II secretory pathway pseudopilin PulG